MIEYRKEDIQKRDKILSDLYLTGRVITDDGKRLYMGKHSSSKINPIKDYIIGWLKVYKVKSTARQNYLLEELYQELFVLLARMEIDKILKLAENPQRLTALACTIIKKRFFYNRPDSIIFRYLKHETGEGEEHLSDNEKLINEEEKNDEWVFKYGIGIDEILDKLEKNEFEDFMSIAHNDNNKTDKQKEDRRYLKKKLKKIKSKIMEEKLFETLKQVEDLFNRYKKSRDIIVKADELLVLQQALKEMKEAHPTIAFPKVLSSGCSGCVKDVLEQSILIFDRLNLKKKVSTSETKEFVKIGNNIEVKETKNFIGNETYQAINETNPFNPIGHDDVEEVKEVVKPKRKYNKKKK